jgi:hypothetical protein
MPLSYLHDDCHKKWLLISESRSDLNRCTPCRGKLDKHATRFPRSVHVCSRTICISRGPHIATLHTSSTALDRVTAPEKKAPDTIHSTPADRSVGPYPVSLLSQQMKQWRKLNICRQHAAKLTGLINTSMWSVHSILAHGIQPLGP